MKISDNFDKIVTAREIGKLKYFISFVVFFLLLKHLLFKHLDYLQTDLHFVYMCTYLSVNKL